MSLHNSYRMIDFFSTAPSNCRDGDIRLINGQSNLDGTVQICYSKQWGAVCGDYPWTSDTSAANTVCKQLGYSGSNAGVYISNYVPQSTIWGGIHCDARANTLLDCFSSYTIGQQNSYFCYSGAGVVCQGTLILNNCPHIFNVSLCY